MSPWAKYYPMRLIFYSLGDFLRSLLRVCSCAYWLLWSSFKWHLYLPWCTMASLSLWAVFKFHCLQCPIVLSFNICRYNPPLCLPEIYPVTFSVSHLVHSLLLHTQDPWQVANFLSPFITSVNPFACCQQCATTYHCGCHWSKNQHFISFGMLCPHLCPKVFHSQFLQLFQQSRIYQACYILFSFLGFLCWDLSLYWCCLKVLLIL